jgi:hypothetical protein
MRQGASRARSGIGAVLYVIAALVTTGPAAAQAPDQEVVGWTAQVEATAAVTAGGSVEVVLEGRIDAGWHLNALTQEGSSPQPLAIRLAPRSSFQLVEFVAPETTAKP